MKKQIVRKNRRKNPLFNSLVTGLGLGTGLAISSTAVKKVFGVKNPVHPQAIESLKRYKSDLKAGHTRAAEYWRGQAGAYFTANPNTPFTTNPIKCLYCGKFMARTRTGYKCKCGKSYSIIRK